MNEFLANLQQDTDPFEGLGDSAETEKSQTETETESQPEKKPEGETESSPEPKEEEPKVEEDAKVFHAFHEHPRWIAREKELQELKKQNEDLLSFKERAEPFLSKFEEKSQTQAPQWFTSLYGDNQEVWNQYLEASNSEKQKIREEILNELKPDLEEIRSVKKQKELQDWADKQWKALESDAEIQKELKAMNLTLDKVQGEISEVMAKYKPSDEDGNISLKTSYELWKATRKQETKPNPIVSEKKKVAAISKSKEEAEEKDYRTSADFRGKTIHDLVE